MTTVCWFFLFWRYFDLVKQVKFGVSGYFLENTWRKWPEILHADHSRLIPMYNARFILWPPSLSSPIRKKFFLSHVDMGRERRWPRWIKKGVAYRYQATVTLMYLGHLQNWLWPRSVDLSNFGTILTWWNGSNLGFPGISWGTHGGNGLKFCMLMYLDHLQNWLVLGHGLLTFVIWHYFDLVKRVKFGVSRHFLENAWREWPEIWYAAVSWPHSELIRLWLLSGDISNFGAILT